MAKQQTRNTATSGDGPIARRLRKMLLKFLHPMSLASASEKKQIVDEDAEQKNKTKQTKLELDKRKLQKRWLTKQMARLGVYNKMNPQQALQLRNSPAAKLQPKVMQKIYGEFLMNLAQSNVYMTNTYQNTTRDTINTKMNNDRIISAQAIANKNRLAPRPDHREG
jgi:hypothetical protein